MADGDELFGVVDVIWFVGSLVWDIYASECASQCIEFVESGQLVKKNGAQMGMWKNPEKIKHYHTGKH